MGDDLVGVYLHGSFALGGADDESDCDFLVVTAAPIDDNQLGALCAFHAGLPHRPGYWNTHLEGAHAPVNDLADLSALDRAWPLSTMAATRSRSTATATPKCCAGRLSSTRSSWMDPAPGPWSSPMTAATMRSAASRDLPKAIDAWANHDRWDAWSQRYAVVTLPRMLRTLVVGDVVSKPTAVAWAMDVFEPRWHPLLETALAQRGLRPWDAPVDPGLVQRTLDFVHYLGQAAEEYRLPQPTGFVRT